jgi:hypothetical protein
LDGSFVVDESGPPATTVAAVVMAADNARDVARCKSEGPDHAPTAEFLALGFAPADLTIWQGLYRDGKTDAVMLDDAYIWSLLVNHMARIANVFPKVSQHDALAWTIAMRSQATAPFFEVLDLWHDVPYGWLPYAAGLTCGEYRSVRPSETDLRLLAVLRGHTLPPCRPQPGPSAPAPTVRVTVHRRGGA